MDEAAEFRELVNGLRAGEAASAAELCRRYAPFIRAAVRRQLHPRLRVRFDSLDLVQDVWASFLAIPTDRYTFDSPAALLGFLTRMARHRATEVFRQRFGSDKNDITRERPVVDVVDVADEAGRDVGQDAIPAATPTPSQWAIAGEEWERLLGRLPAGHRVVLERLREGYTYDDVARMTAVSVSTIDRIVRRLKTLTGL